MPGRASANAAAVELKRSAPRVVVDRATAAAFVDLFLPSLATNPKAYEKGALIYAPTKVGGPAWLHALRRVDVRALVNAHLVAGAAGAPQQTALGEIRAIGAKFDDRDLVRVLNVDLDGGVKPEPIAKELRRLFGGASTFVTSGSGRPGRFRVLVRIVDTTVAEVRELTTRIIESIGASVASGGVEIYPSPKPGRLPFGMGGCTVFVDEALQVSECYRPRELVSRLLDAPRVDLRKVLEQQLELQPVDTQKEAEKTHVAPLSKGRRVRAVDPVLRNARHQELVDNGASPGARDAEVFTAYRIFRTQAAARSRSEKEAKELTKELARDWLLRGGIARTNRAKEHRGIERELQDVARKVDAILYPMARPAPQHLTESEIERVVTIAEAAPAGERAGLVVLLLRVLPLFKAAAVAGMPDVRFHSDQWAKLAGGRRYSRLRQASGQFVQVAPHRSKELMRKLGRPESDATAKTWACTFDFDAVAPARAAFGAPRTKSDADIYRAATLTAERVRRRMQSRKARNISGIILPSENISHLSAGESAPAPRCSPPEGAGQSCPTVHGSENAGERAAEGGSNPPGSDFTFLRRSPGSW